MATPTQKPKRKQSESKEKCSSCNKLSGDDRWLSCEVCDSWFHAKCQDISPEAHKILQDIVTCHWFCKSCDNKMRVLIPTLGKLNDRIVAVETQLDKISGEVKIEMAKVKTEINNTNLQVDKFLVDCSTEMEELKVKVAEINDKLINQIEEQKNSEIQASLLSDVVKKQVDKTLETVSENIHEVRAVITETREQAAEERDKESRRNNIIIYKVPERDELRAEDRNKADISFCLQLFNSQMQLGMTEDDFQNVFRLGRRGDVTRPLLVQFVTYSSKNILMESLYKLKHADSKFRSVVISHDMTKCEREDCKRLVEEAKVKASDDTSGEFVYRVRGLPGQMKIVKFRVRQQ